MTVTPQKRAVGTFSNPQKAEQALSEVKASGFLMDNISVIARDANHGDQLTDAEVSDRVGDTKVETATAVIANAANTSAIGSVFVGLTSLALPGIGPILAAGTLGIALVATVAGTGVGAIAANSLVKALTDLGIPEEQARVYGDHLHRGHYLVIVEGTDDEINQAETSLTKQDIENWNIYELQQA